MNFYIKKNILKPRDETSNKCSCKWRWACLLSRMLTNAKMRACGKCSVDGRATDYALTHLTRI